MSFQRWQGRSPLEAFPVSIGLLGACAVLFAATDLIPGMKGSGIKEWGANSQVGFASGQVWRPVTSMFLHGGLLHIALNMWAFWQLCPALERNIGSARFAAIYFGAGIAGSMASMMFEHGSLGASGAICGVMACYLRFERVALGSFKAVARDPFASQFLVWLLINIAMGFGINSVGHGPGISNAAHIGGILGGWAFSAAVVPALSGRDRGRLGSRPSIPKLASCLLVIAGLGVLEPFSVWTAWYQAKAAAAASRAGDTPGALARIEKARHSSFGQNPYYYFDLGLEAQTAGRDEVAEAFYALAEDNHFYVEELGHNEAILIQKKGDDRKLLDHLRKWSQRGVPLSKWEDRQAELERQEARGELGR